MADPADVPFAPPRRETPPSWRSERSQREPATSLGIGSLRGSASEVRQVDAYEQVRRRGTDLEVDDGGAVGLATRPITSTGAPTRPPTVPAAAPMDEPAAPPTGGRPGQILAIEECGPTVRVFRVGRPAGFTFQPGQYVKLGVPGGEREDFSIASAPHEPHLELAIELRPGGTVTPALFALRVGDAVDMSPGAKGKLLLDKSASHHLMVATVTGIAPLVSMVRDALHRGTSTTFTVVLGASYATELPLHAELESLAAADPRLTYIPTVSRPTEAANQGWTGSAGRADVVAAQMVGDFDAGSTHVYAVGNKGMIQSVVRAFGGAGFAVSTESYGG